MSPPRTPGPAAELLAELCETLAARPEFRGESAATALADMTRQCREPLRVAVTGDVSTGKSTLVNAFLGQELAATARTETTSNVTWYHHPDLPPDARIGAGHRYEAVSFPLADRVILVDTPGVNTPSPNEKITDAMINGASAAAGAATVLLYLCHKTVSAGAKNRIDQFSRLAADSFGHGFNVVLVGAKADEGGVDPADIGANLEREAALLGIRTATVIQQLAVVARTGTLRPEHLDTLRIIAGDPELRQDYVPFGWPMLRIGWQVRGYDNAAIDALWRLTPTTFGIQGCMAGFDSGQISGVDDLAAAWERLSGLAALEDLLDELAADADVLTVNAVSGRLRRLGASLGPERAALIRERLGALRREARFARLDLTTAALALRTSLFADLAEHQRIAAVDLLRAPGPPAPELARSWRRLAAQPGRSTFARHVASIVADAALGQTYGGTP
jgi:hypothetical protein